jgi:hypothetical protein
MLLRWLRKLASLGQRGPSLWADHGQLAQVAPSLDERIRAIYATLSAGAPHSTRHRTRGHPRAESAVEHFLHYISPACQIG